MVIHFYKNITIIPVFTPPYQWSAEIFDGRERLLYSTRWDDGKVALKDAIKDQSSIVEYAKKIVDHGFPYTTIPPFRPNLVG